MTANLSAAVDQRRLPRRAAAARRGLAYGHSALRAGIPASLAVALALAAFQARLAPAGAASGNPVSHSHPPLAWDGRADAGWISSLHPAVARWQANILQWAHQRSLPPELIAVVIQIESCGDPTALSVSGAAGLFQVMPFHFSAGESPLDIETNSRRGLDYLERSLELAGGSPALALAGYNGGHGVIPLAPEQWPSETQRYVSWGTGILEDLRHLGQASPTLRAWLSAGGEHLCRQAEAHIGPSG